MALRQAPFPPPALPPTEASTVRGKTYQCTLLTPLFGGGVRANEVDTAMPIRASSIRGQLRFWWRLLAEHKYKINHLADRRAAEFALWGGMGAGDGKAHASLVFIHTGIAPDANVKTFNANAAFSDKDYADCRYALFPLESNKTAEALAYPGLTFALNIRFSPQITAAQQAQAEEALRWWATFGGLGGRTRRGLGAVQVADVLPVSQQEADAAGCKLVCKGDYPAPLMAWKEAVGKLRAFRQGTKTGEGRNPGSSDPKRPGRSRWPEPDALRRLSKRHASRHAPEHKAGNLFPRAALGMPVIFEIRGTGEPPKCSLQPKGKERMASPVILRPYPLASGKWAAAALLLPHAHVWQQDLELTQGFKYSGNELLKTKWWPADTKQQQQATQHIMPMQTKQRGTDPLTAFLAFFGE